MVHRLGGEWWCFGGRHTGVVELASLANGKTTRANNKHLLNVDLLLRFYHAALEVGLGVRGGLGGGSAGSGGREETFLGQPGHGGFWLCAEDAILRGRGECRQLGGGYWDAATMTEDGRSAARLVHGRQHYMGKGACSR